MMSPGHHIHIEGQEPEPLVKVGAQVDKMLRREYEGRKPSSLIVLQNIKQALKDTEMK